MNKDISCNSAITACVDSDAGNPRLMIAEWSDVKFISHRGVYALYSATRYGRRYFLKGLAEKYRNLPEWNRLLFKEFEIGVQLDHPGIARTVSWENIPGAGEVLVMEYIDGLELGEWLKNDKGRERKEREVVLGRIVEALDYLHAAGVSHRDLKPDNILITHKGNRVKIIDFGLGDSDEFIVYKSSVGTEGFGAPEQREEKTREAAMSADIYALGKIMELMLPERRYRGLIKQCLRTDPSSRPTASLVLKQLNRKNRMPVVIIGGSVIAIIIFSLVCYILIQKDNEFTRNHSVQAINEIQKPVGDSVVVRDTVFVEKRDTVIVETAGSPKESAIKAQWDKIVRVINSAMEVCVNYDFPDKEDHLNEFEKSIPVWQDELYHSLLAIGCSDEIAKRKREELADYILRYAKKLRAAKPFKSPIVIEKHDSVSY